MLKILLPVLIVTVLLSGCKSMNGASERYDSSAHLYGDPLMGDMPLNAIEGKRRP